MNKYGFFFVVFLLGNTKAQLDLNRYIKQMMEAGSTKAAIAEKATYFLLVQSANSNLQPADVKYLVDSVLHIDAPNGVLFSRNLEQDGYVISMNNEYIIIASFDDPRTMQAVSKAVGNVINSLSLEAI